MLIDEQTDKDLLEYLGTTYHFDNLASVSNGVVTDIIKEVFFPNPIRGHLKYTPDIGMLEDTARKGSLLASVYLYSNPFTGRKVPTEVFHSTAIGITPPRRYRE